MDAIKRENCRKFFYSLPDFPKIVNAGYDPIDDVIFLPATIEEDSPLYFQQIAHEYFHKKLYQFDVRNIVNGDEDFRAFEEIVSECGSMIILSHLGVINEVKDKQINYIREWKGNLNNKSLLSKVFPVVKEITEKILGLEISKKDLPIDVRVLLGLF
jgi:antirestriction protein ArdC